MGLRGPRPQATVVKLLKGNPGRRPINMNEPKPPPGAPDVPPGLDTEQQVEFDKVCRWLAPMGLLTKADQTIVAAYAVSLARFWVLNRRMAMLQIEIESTWATHRTMSDEIRTEGELIQGARGSMKPNPRLKALHRLDMRLAVMWNNESKMAKEQGQRMGQLRAYADHLGLSPSARSKLHAGPVKDEPDELESLIR